MENPGEPGDDPVSVFANININIIDAIIYPTIGGCPKLSII